MNEETIKYSSYTPAQKKASQVYRLKNKDKINEQRKKYYQARKEADPAFLEYKRTKAKEYYDKKKLIKSGIVTDVPDVVEIPTEPELKPEVVEPVEEVKPEKAKRQRKPRTPSPEAVTVAEPVVIEPEVVKLKKVKKIKSPK